MSDLEWYTDENGVIDYDKYDQDLLDSEESMNEFLRDETTE